MDARAEYAQLFLNMKIEEYRVVAQETVICQEITKQSLKIDLQTFGKLQPDYSEIA
jgi:hypothetical protein